MSRREKHIDLTEPEIITLREGSKYHPKVEFRERCRALLLNEAGVTIKQIATHLDVNHNTIGKWISNWETRGIVGLHRRVGQGRSPILSVANPDHLKHLDKAVEKYSQNVKAIQAHLLQELGTPMSSDTVKRFLKKLTIPGDASAGVRTRAKTK